MTLYKKLISTLLVVSCLLNITACSYFFGDEGVFRDRKKDYRHSTSLERVVVPEPLDSQAIVDFYPVPPLSSYSDGEMIDELPLPVGVANTQAPVKVQTMPNKQWVLLQVSASQAWPRLKEFINKEGLNLTVENGAAGMLETHSGAGVYRFRIEQGFQRNSSELSVRFLHSSAETAAFWPEQSVDRGVEEAMVKKVAQFFADSSEGAVFSFAAQGISTKKKIDITYNDSGDKYLTLMVEQDRAWLTLVQSLRSAEFALGAIDDAKKTIVVQYTPPLIESEQPGAFKRFFGVKRKPYDKSVKYAGKHYQFALTSAVDNATISVQALDAEDLSKDMIRKEQNAIILLFKERLY